MEDYERYFVCSYYNEIWENVGVFKKETPENVIIEAKKIFDIVEFD